MPVNYNFEWDPTKARANLDKHGRAFDEAATVFKDPRAISIFDPDHSETEDRWVTMGISEKGRLLIVIQHLSKRRRRYYHNQDNHKPKSDKTRNRILW